MKVPMLDLVRQYQAMHEEIDTAIHEVLRSGRFILGSLVEEFEKRAAEYCGVGHAIGVASGTDALLLSLRALGVGPGDRVIVPSFSFFATAGVVHNVGATPVFCDIDPKTFNIDPESVRELLHDRRTASSTRAIIPVHLYGQIANMDAIREIAQDYRLAIVEDAAQAIGAVYRGEKAGAFGNTGCFRFYPTKNLGAYGDGGLVTTNDGDLAGRVRLLRVHGAKPKYFHRLVGVNSRLDAIQAAVLSVKLRYLDRWTGLRVQVADEYDSLLRDLEGIVIPQRKPDRSHIFHQYTVRLLNGRRDELQRYLSENGVGSMIYYPMPLHLQECFAGLGYVEGDLPASELAAREVLSLPIYPELTSREIEFVAGLIEAYLQRDWD